MTCWAVASPLKATAEIAGLLNLMPEYAAMMAITAHNKAPYNAYQITSWAAETGGRLNTIRRPWSSRA